MDNFYGYISNQLRNAATGDFINAVSYSWQVRMQTVHAVSITIYIATL